MYEHICTVSLFTLLFSVTLYPLRCDCLCSLSHVTGHKILDNVQYYNVSPLPLLGMVRAHHHVCIQHAWPTNGSQTTYCPRHSVARGDICSEKRSFNPSCGAAETTLRQFWKLMSCLFVEICITLLIYFVKKCDKMATT